MDFPIPFKGQQNRTMSRCAVRSTDEALQTAVVRHGVLWLVASEAKRHGEVEIHREIASRLAIVKWGCFC